MSVSPDGSSRKIAKMFGLLESMKVGLRIQEYSISQTSLEQIFNQFASQQEEEMETPPQVQSDAMRNDVRTHSNGYTSFASEVMAVEMVESMERNGSLLEMSKDGTRSK